MVYCHWLVGLLIWCHRRWWLGLFHATRGTGTGLRQQRSLYSKRIAGALAESALTLAQHIVAQRWVNTEIKPIIELNGRVDLIHREICWNS